MTTKRKHAYSVTSVRKAQVTQHGLVWSAHILIAKTLPLSQQPGQALDTANL